MKADFEEMYYSMVRASETAIRALITAQQTCEEMYMAYEEKETELIVLGKEKEMHCHPEQSEGSPS